MMKLVTGDSPSMGDPNMGDESMTDGGAPGLAGGEPRGRLRIAGVGKHYRTATNTVHVLDDITIDVAPGEFVCLVGASGCGKSTLLDIVAGLTQPDTGHVEADGEVVTEPGRQRLVMFQEAALFPWLDALGNVMFGLKLCPEYTDAERREIARAHLELVGLAKFEQAYVHQLSGGMKQRVALARVLAPKPPILLLDEPFAALDAMTREQLYDDLQRIWERHAKTILLVTHNVREAVCLADRVILMTPSPGRISAEFAIDLPRPRDINGDCLSRQTQEITRALKQATGGGAAGHGRDRDGEVHE